MYIINIITACRKKLLIKIIINYEPISSAIEIRVLLIIFNNFSKKIFVQN